MAPPSFVASGHTSAVTFVPSTRPLLDALPADDRERLLSSARPRRFGRNDVVFHAGAPAAGLHLVTTGHFAVQASTPAGDIVTLAVLGPNESFGEHTVFTGASVRAATVKSLDASETLEFGAADLHQLREERPAVDRFLVSLLVQQVNQMSERLIEALFVSSQGRVLLRLLALTEQYSGGSIPVSQADLAELAGVGRSTTNRTLREAETAGFVELRRSAITVLDVAGLSSWLRDRPNA
jgi:CRP/FNR family cyclic AMP-dependent transcriptional regulator